MFPRSGPRLRRARVTHQQDVPWPTPRNESSGMCPVFSNMCLGQPKLDVTKQVLQNLMWQKHWQLGHMLGLWLNMAEHAAIQAFLQSMLALASVRAGIENFFRATRFVFNSGGIVKSINGLFEGTELQGNDLALCSDRAEEGLGVLLHHL